MRHSFGTLGREYITQQTQNVSVKFLESCSLVASDLTLQKRFYNVLSDLCLEMSNIQKHVCNVVYVRLKLSSEILFERHKSCRMVAVLSKLYPTLSQRCCNVRQASRQYP